MGTTAQSIILSKDSAAVTTSFDAKTNFLSVRFIRDSDEPLPSVSSSQSNILLNGKCLDPENRKLYMFFIDVFYNAAWIIEVDVDTRAQTIVYYDPSNNIGFSPDHKIHNPLIVFGKIIWTDGNAPIYQIDIARAKRSFYYQIGYSPNENIIAWENDVYYYPGQIITHGNYFYKSLLAGQAKDPAAESTYWQQLCLIEEAYYSMKVENFYFAAIPPDLPPVVEYVADAQRNLNNLRQTLFQFAYNYIYLDWRESTYSPACIVPMPNSEEEIATGLATEMLSRNNCLKISVNSGGEEVRKIRIIGRSNRDPSTWFLVEEIDKFSEDEKILGGATGAETEIGTLGEVNITISVPIPLVLSNGISIPGYPDIELSFPNPVGLSFFVTSTENSILWGASDNGAAAGVTATITAPVGSATLVSKPAWISGVNFLLHALIPGTSILDGTDIVVYPNAENTGAERTGTIILTDSYGDLCSIEVTQEAASVPPVVILTPEEFDTWSIVSGSSTAANTYITVGSTILNISFKAQDLDSPSAVILTVEILKNGVHLMWDTTPGRNLYQTSDTFTLPVAAAEGDVYVVILNEP